MKTTLITGALLASIAVAAPAFAQAAGGATAATTTASAGKPVLTVGSKVYGPQNEEVGTIESTSGGAVVVYTGTARATLAEASFAAGAQGPVIGLSKAQLEAAVQQASAQADAAKTAALVPGAEVRSKDGILVGKVEKVAGDEIIIARAAGPVTLTRSFLTVAPQGGLSLVMTAAEFDAAAKAAQASAKPDPKSAG